MHILPISCCDNINSKGNPKIPDCVLTKQQEKLKDIQAKELASAFGKFEESLRATIEAFVYMINK